MIYSKCDIVGSSLGAWLLTNPTSTIGWYDKLAKIATTGDNIENLEIVQNQLTSEKCLSMNRISDSSHKFHLNAAACNEKRRAICRLDAPVVAIPTKPPQFPCIKGEAKRRKRSIYQSKYEAG